MRPSSLVIALVAASMAVLAAVPSSAVAQTTASIPDDAPRTPGVEEPDRTRLDVERLPPEAIHITRDLYAHGFLLEAELGARGFLGGVGRLSDPGVYVAVGFGYEILDWLFVRALAEMSIHQMHAPGPPATSAFELMGAVGEVRLQTHPTAEFALWIAAQAGFIVATSDVLGLYGLQPATVVGFAYGGEVGVDAHFHSRHYSIGLLGGTRLAPSLDGPGGDTAIGIHGAAYVRYVF